MNTTDKIIPTVERWLPIPGYEGLYEVSDHGRVKSLPRTVNTSLRHCATVVRPERIMRVHVRKSGHIGVGLTNGGVSTTMLVHHLVLKSFFGERPKGHQTRHLNGNPMDNRLCNLAYGTPRENSLDKYAHGTVVRGERVKTSKLTESEVMEIYALKGAETSASVAKRLGVSFSNVCLIWNHSRWSWLTNPDIHRQAVQEAVQKAVQAGKGGGA